MLQFRKAAMTMRAMRAAIGILAAATMSAPTFADQGLLPSVTAIPRAEEGDALRLAVFDLVRFDSNFFRLPDSVEPPDGSRRSALTHIGGVGLNVDKVYGLQQITVNASLARTQYPSHGALDETSTRINADYQWKLTPSLSGNVRYDDVRTPTDYEYSGFQTSPSTTRQRTTSASIGWPADASVQGRLAIFSAENRTSSPTFQVESSRSTGATLGALYVTHAGNTLQLYATASRGRTLDADDDPADLISPDFSGLTYGLRVVVNPVNELHGTADIGYTRRTHSQFSVRDFSGPIGTVDLVYDVTGKTSIELSAERTLNDSQTPFSSYFVQVETHAGVRWRASNKITVRPQFVFRRQDFRDAPFAAPTLVEVTRYQRLEVDWDVLRSLDVAFLVSRSHRAASDSMLQFQDRSGSVFARFKF